ncbi:MULTISPECIES: peptidylprolyl isomerase [Myxococcaceae]|uniref:peptidylprolyl isomerase n=1 Tax=Myxococcaceae TaxID=31 RepID=UPI00188FFAA8|nr:MULTISPECIES: peptidylprolyl isomerase [Myxococcaceae]MBF5040870.1 peptidylprolyl isomerase [Simulacricoccus sp. 17bor-14]
MSRPFSLSALLLAVLMLAAPAFAAGNKWTQRVAAGQDVWATVQTSQGDFTLRLFSKDAPKTVASFVGLATGQKEWTNPETGKPTKKPLYEGVTFHRVIPGFMIQGGDPTGTGAGSVGFNVPDEFHNGHTFDKPGMAAMANVGRPDTNSSQFFVTVAPTQYLNDRHTIFGEVVQGYDVVEKISKVPTSRGNRPEEPVVIRKVVLSDRAPGAKAPPAKAAPAKGKGASAAHKP